MITKTRKWMSLCMILAGLTAAGLWGCQHLLHMQTPSQKMEVWALDQSDTDPAGGGLLYIWDAHALSHNARQAGPLVIDLAQSAREAGCDVAKRPHMVLPNHTEPPSHVVIANVGSGDIFFVDAATRKVVGCVSVKGAGGIGTAKAHAATVAPDDGLVLVADIAGNALHKIQTDFSANRYALVETLDLKASREALGTSAAKPICLEFTADSRFAYVTMAQGGLAVVETGSADGTTPMRVVKAYDKKTVPGKGCGTFRLPDGDMLTNGESGAKGGDDFLYQFATGGADTGFFPDPVQISLPGEDTHGVGLCTDQEGHLFAVTAMRVSNDINIIDLESQKVVKTQSMARVFSPDPKPDVAYLEGHKMYIALRGAKPLTAIGALKNPDRTPGVAVLTLSQDCRSIEWTEKDLATMGDTSRTVTLKGSVQVSASDPHGLLLLSR